MDNTTDVMNTTAVYSNTFFNIVFFVIITIIYLVFKPQIALKNVNEEEMQNYNRKSYIMLIIYFVITLFSQFFINIYILVMKCKGNISKNLRKAALITFLPWSFVFGTIIGILVVFPGFKSVFSDVIGYFVVSNTANKILSRLLTDSSTKEVIDNISENSEIKKKDYERAAEAIIKLLGNISLLINQIVPDNFNQYWETLKPLMKDQYKNDENEDTIELKQNLYNAVLLKDNIGEFLWYIYTGILLISIVQYYIVSGKCQRDRESMQKEYSEFLNTQQTIKDQQDNTKTTYVRGP
jgi:hypothetical protein